jgi:hypothetical protein
LAAVSEAFVDRFCFSFGPEANGYVENSNRDLYDIA